MVKTTYKKNCWNVVMTNNCIFFRDVQCDLEFNTRIRWPTPINSNVSIRHKVNTKASKCGLGPHKGLLSCTALKRDTHWGPGASGEGEVVRLFSAITTAWSRPLSLPGEGFSTERVHECDQVVGNFRETWLPLELNPPNTKGRSPVL